MNRESTRVKELESRRILDEATRERRNRKALEMLDADNHHPDPHENLVLNTKAPKFSDSLEADKRKKSRNKVQVCKKTFTQLLDEDQYYNPEPPNYTTALVNTPTHPQRHFCAVCGDIGAYTCIVCGTRFCSCKCQDRHQSTRCQKWIT